MKIAIDGYELHKSFTGVGRYLHNLLEAILKVDEVNKYTIFLKENSSLLNDFDNLNIKVLKSNRSHTRWQNTNLLDALNQGNFDLFFSPNHSIPLFYKKRSFLTIHDPSWKTMKDDYSFKERVIRDIKTKISIKKAEKVFTVSEFSRTETLKFYKIKENDIIAIHSGVEPTFKKSSDKEILLFKKKFGLDPKKTTIGFLGSMFKRRHIKELIEVFNELKKDIPLQMILIGNDYYKGELDTLLKSNSIIWKNRIDEKDINDFYSSLDIFVYLSDYEGFGFPPLEALKCETISMLLNTSSLKEVFKDIAFFIDDTSTKTIGDSIRYILNNYSDIKNKINKNFETKDSYYTWERAAKKYLDFF